jgi:hypothetical protein
MDDETAPRRATTAVFIRDSMSAPRYRRAPSPVSFARVPMREECFSLEDGGDWYVVERVLHVGHPGAAHDAEVWGRRIGLGDGDTDR